MACYGDSFTDFYPDSFTGSLMRIVGLGVNISAQNTHMRAGTLRHLRARLLATELQTFTVTNFHLNVSCNAASQDVTHSPPPVRASWLCCKPHEFGLLVSRRQERLGTLKTN
jgi:hypothetical protein